MCFWSVLLVSCKTGNGFGKQLAQELKTSVYAPKRNVAYGNGKFVMFKGESSDELVKDIFGRVVSNPKKVFTAFFPN